MSTSKNNHQRDSDPRLGAGAVIERLKEACGVSTDVDLANALRTAKPNISKWRSRNSIPYAEAVYVAMSKGVSLDYLLTGSGTVGVSPRLPSNLDPEFIRAGMEILVQSGLLAIPKGRAPAETLQAAATSIAFQYERAERAMYELVSRKGLSVADARSAAIVAMEMLEAEISALRLK